MCFYCDFFFFFKQKTAYEMRISDWSSDVCSSDLKPVASGLWVAQDTGGAIKGANRFDTFWGAGAEAKRIAGGMQANGDAYVLLPKGTVSRLNSDYAASRR